MTARPIAMVPSSRNNNNSNSINEDDPMITCRLQIERWLQPQIAHWIQQELPILDWVSRLPNGILQIQFLSEHLKWTNSEKTQGLVLKHFHWYCGTTNSSTNGTYHEPAMVHHVSKSHLFFLHCNLTSIQQHNHDYDEEDVDIQVWTNDSFPSSTKKHVTTLYQLKPLMDCDAIEQQQYGKPPTTPQSPTTTTTNNNNNIQLAMCSVLYGYDASAMLVQFAEYYAHYKRLGVQHFWVFVNTATTTTTTSNGKLPSTSLLSIQLQPQSTTRTTYLVLPNVDDVTYIPYNFRWNDFMKYANFSAPFLGASMWQEAMQNQCLSRLRRYGVKWIMTLDVDEFVEIRGNNDESSRRDKEEEYPLRSFLSRYDQDANNKRQKDKPVGALRMRSVPFPTNRKFDLPTFRPYRMAMDHVHRWDDTLGTYIDAKRPKMIYQAQLCDVAGVHWCRRYNRGAISQSLNATHEIMLHHIRAATAVTNIGWVIKRLEEREW
ncbi:unnamed protein product [Cylindrotheca closterium]|uniref:Glycosyltransferase family 92 protein n=1 Tax=Cylindrotheca closterium TaxID=2856 RepID=A0AAD2PXV7_9STRA|nr:unnamed protein product [Cylindrotheca closterium]